MIRSLLLGCLLAAAASSSPLLPDDKWNEFRLIELERQALTALDVASDVTNAAELRFILGNKGQWVEGGIDYALRKDLAVEFWLTGTSHEQGEFLLGTHTTRGGWTGRVQHGLIQYHRPGLLIELGRRNLTTGLNTISELGWSRQVPAVDMIRYQLSTQKPKLSLDVICGQLSDIDNPLMDRWYVSHRVVWRQASNPRNMITFGDHAIFAGEGRGLELQFLSPFVPSFLENFEGYSEADNQQTIDGDNSSLFLAWSWWIPSGFSSSIRSYGEVLIDEFQLDAEDREMLDNVYGLTLGIETSMLPLWGKATSIQLEASALSPWIYVHRGAGTSFNEKGHVIGNENGGDLREGQLRFNIEWSKQLKLLIGGSVIQTGATNGDWLWQAEESNGLSWPISPTRKRATGQLAFEYSIGKKSGLQGYLQVEKGQGLTEARLALRMGIELETRPGQ